MKILIPFLLMFSPLAAFDPFLLEHISSEDWDAFFMRATFMFYEGTPDQKIEALFGVLYFICKDPVSCHPQHCIQAIDHEISALLKKKALPKN